jgi:hypothetical protein
VHHVTQPWAKHRQREGRSQRAGQTPGWRSAGNPGKQHTVLGTQR